MLENIETVMKKLELHINATKRIPSKLELPYMEKLKAREGHDPIAEEFQQNLSALESPGAKTESF